MNFTVVITEPAEKQIEVAYKWLVERTPQHAAIWHDGLVDALLSLESSPERCPLAAESAGNGFEVRQLL